MMGRKSLFEEFRLRRRCLDHLSGNSGDRDLQPDLVRWFLAQPEPRQLGPLIAYLVDMHRALHVSTAFGRHTKARRTTIEAIAAVAKIFPDKTPEAINKAHKRYGRKKPDLPDRMREAQYVVGGLYYEEWLSIDEIAKIFGKSREGDILYTDEDGRVCRFSERTADAVRDFLGMRGYLDVSDHILDDD